MSLDEYYAKIEARKKKFHDIRAAGKKHWAPEVKRLLTELRALLPECGLTDMQISNGSGVVRSTMGRIKKTRFDSARFDTVVQLLGTAGYKFKIEPIDPYDDAFRDMRVFKLPPLEEKDRK